MTFEITADSDSQNVASLAVPPTLMVGLPDHRPKLVPDCRSHMVRWCGSDSDWVVPSESRGSLDPQSGVGEPQRGQRPTPSNLGALGVHMRAEILPGQDHEPVVPVLNARAVGWTHPRHMRSIEGAGSRQGAIHSIGDTDHSTDQYPIPPGHGTPHRDILVPFRSKRGCPSKTRLD
eukprot:690590-Rhodomonas_salina.3